MPVGGHPANTTWGHSPVQLPGDKVGFEALDVVVLFRGPQGRCEIETPLDQVEALERVGRGDLLLT
jgi:hypothetical protein